MSALVKAQPQANWPNLQSIVTATTFTVGLVSQIQLPDRMWQTNAPFRMSSFIYAVYRADFRKAACDVAAAGAILLPGGGFIASIIDLTREWLNYKSNLVPFSEENLTEVVEVDRNMALRLFNLGENSAIDENWLKSTMDAMTNDLRTKKNDLPPGELSADVDKVIAKLEQAYKILLKDKTT